VQRYINGKEVINVEEHKLQIDKNF
jgi:hypothetical protein